MSSPTVTRRLAFVAAAIALCGATWRASAHADDRVLFPDGYRRWAHVRSTIIGPEAEGFANNGGIHHYYANAQALAGYADGKFADGSVLIDDALEARTASGVTTEGSRRRLAVMVKDAQRFASTGGWGFEIFPGDTRSGVLTSERRASCSNCHAQGRDGVMTQLRP